MSYRYWHLACAATKVANELAPALAAYEGELEGRAEVEALVREHMKPEMPFAEHAPNGRARCRGCDETIPKGELRVAFERMFEGPAGPQKAAAYAHARCLAKYLEREKEAGREAPAPSDLLATVERHSGEKLAPEDLAALREGLGTA
ncbi:MAG TPA: PARP-type zinc finger-containing protein [Polyangiaceae bacterium]